MPRYVRQRDKFRCGPVGILNALKWAEAPVTGKLLPTLCRQASCRQPNGTYPSDLALAIVTSGKKYFTARIDYRPTLGRIENSLTSGKAVLLNFLYNERNNKGERSGHYTLITGVSSNGKTFDVINHVTFEERRPDRIRRHTLRNLMYRRKYEDEWYPIAWHITKK